VEVVETYCCFRGRYLGAVCSSIIHTRLHSVIFWKMVARVRVTKLHLHETSIVQSDVGY
jgi:hypothetical protein